MKVVLLSTSDMGGAGIAAKRLHLALLAMGVSSKLVTLVKEGETIAEQYTLHKTTKNNFFKRVINRIAATLKYRLPFLYKTETDYLKNRPAGFDMFSFPYSDERLHENEFVKQADLVHLHWVSDNMLDYTSFFKNIKKPVVWTLHDMNPFTGGCHHSDGSMEFTIDCLDCKQVKNTVNEKIAAENLAIKINAMQDVPDKQVSIVTPSQWLGSLSKQSRLFKRFNHYTLPNIVDETVFKPGDKKQLRKAFNIEENAKVLLFVSNDVMNPRKGMRELISAINGIELPGVTVVTVGKKINVTDINKNIVQLGFVGSQQLMAEIYAMADVFVLPSHAENFPNSIIEAFFCGIPVVASNVGGIPEQINSNNGLLFNNADITALREALTKVLSGAVVYNSTEIREQSLLKYSAHKLLNEYLNIYQNALK